MYLTPDIALQQRLIKRSVYLIIAVIIIATLVLIGWEFDITVFKSLVKGSVAMNPATAVGFILLSLSSLLYATKKRSYIIAGHVITIVVGTNALLRLLTIVSVIDFPIDKLFFKEKVKAIATPVSSSTAALYTAICFILLCISLLIRNTNNERKIAGQIAILITGFTGLLFLLGYLYQPGVFTAITDFSPMAIHTAICFIILATAFLFSMADIGLMKEVTSTFTGSITARSFIPAAIVIPAVLGSLRLYGNKMGFYSNEFGVAVFATSITTMFFILIWYNTVLLNRRDIVKAITAQELQKSIEQNAYLASLLNNTSDAVFSTDQSFVIKSWNRAAEEIYGISAEEAIGKTTLELIKTKVSDEERLTIRDNLVNRGYFIADVIHFDKNGKLLEMLVSTTATKNAAGDTIGYISICHNISERKTLETQLQKTNAELEAFTYSVSHDLRAPLRGIIGFTAILEEEYAAQLDDEARRLTGVIKNNAMRMGNLIDDLLNFSRLGRNSINKIKFDTMQMVKQVIIDVGDNKNRTTIEWILHPLPEIEADINTVRQVWVNLISNAVKYSGNNEHPVIEIGTTEKNGQQVFFVKDNGVGFDQKYSDKLFKVFQRLHSAAEFEGTGVGLALVEKIISRHDGMIWAEAELNKGATFYFTFTNKIDTITNNK